MKNSYVLNILFQFNKINICSTIVRVQYFKVLYFGYFIGCYILHYNGVLLYNILIAMIQYLTLFRFWTCFNVFDVTQTLIRLRYDV